MPIIELDAAGNPIAGKKAIKAVNEPERMVTYDPDGFRASGSDADIVGASIKNAPVRLAQMPIKEALLALDRPERAAAEDQTYADLTKQYQDPNKNWVDRRLIELATLGHGANAIIDATRSGVVNAINPYDKADLKAMNDAGDFAIAENNQDAYVRSGDLGKEVVRVGAGMLEQAPAIALAGVGGDKAGAVGAALRSLPALQGFTTEQGDSYQEQLAAGFTPTEAYNAGSLSGVAEGQFEGLSAGSILAKSPIKQKIANTLVSGSGSEMLTSGVQGAIRKGTTDPEMTLDQYGYDALVAGLGGGAVDASLGAVSSGADYLANRTGRAASVPPTIQTETEQSPPPPPPPAPASAFTDNIRTASKPIIEDPTSHIDEVINGTKPVEELVADAQKQQEGWEIIDITEGADGTETIGQALYNPTTGETKPLAGQDPQAMLDALNRNKTPEAVEKDAAEEKHVEAVESIEKAREATETDITPEQRQTGKYAKGKVDLNGLRIRIETPKGSERNGVDKDGESWSVKMPADYGYISRTKGADGEEVDVYIGDNPTIDKVFVIDQNDADTGEFDEHKVMMGYASARDALTAYEQGFSDGKGMQRVGKVKEMTTSELRTWLASKEYKEKYTQTQVMERAKEYAKKERVNGGLDKYEAEDATAVRGAMRAKNEDARTSPLNLKRPTLSNLETVPEDNIPALVLPSQREPFKLTEERIHVIQRINPETKKVVEHVVYKGYPNLGTALRSSGLSDSDIGSSAEMSPQQYARFEKYKSVTGNKTPLRVESYQKGSAERVDTAPSNAEPQAPTPQQSATDDAIKPSKSTTKDVNENTDAKNSANNFNASGEKIGSEPSAFKPVESDIPNDIGNRLKETFRRIDEGIATKNYNSLYEIMRNLDNKNSRKRFFEKTGVKLPRTVFGTKQALKEFTGYQDDADSSPATDVQVTTLAPQVREEVAQVDTKSDGDNPSPTESTTAKRLSDSDSTSDGKSETEQVSSIEDLVDDFQKHFENGEGFKTITQAREFAVSLGLSEKISAQTNNAKQLEEIIELATVKAARTIVQKGKSTAETYDALHALYMNMPPLNTRTSHSRDMQAYSTPAPIAYAASKLGNIAAGNAVYEPTAGHGMLLLEVSDQSRIIANEFDKVRADRLKDLLPRATVTQKDASTMALSSPVDRIIMNPPFGRTVSDNETRRKWVFDGVQVLDIDHAIALQSLQDMTDDGRAVMLIGSQIGKNKASPEKWSDLYNTQKSRRFFKKLYDDYNVTEHLILNGDMYKRQGASFPIDVIVIDGKGKSSRKYPAAQVPEYIASYDELKKKIEGIPNAKPQTIRAENAPKTVPVRDSLPSDKGGRDNNRDVSDADSGAVSQPDTGGSEVIGRGRNNENDSKPNAVSGTDNNGNGVKSKSNGSRDSGDGSVSTESDKPASTVITDKDVSDAGDQSGSVGGRGDAARAVSVASDRRRDREGLATDSRGFQRTYKPISQGKALDTLVPTKMSDAVYRSIESLEQEYGDIDDFVAKELDFGKGKAGRDALYKALGAEQIEAVALAIGNMKSGRGFILGDQTGIGKGRVVASVLKWAKLQDGVIPVFVSENTPLFAAMIRDLDDIGVKGFRPFVTNQELKGKDRLFVEQTGSYVESLTPKKYKEFMDEVKSTGQLPEGFDAIFTTYSQLQSIQGKPNDRHYMFEKSIQNMVIAFDESHNAGAGAMSRTKQKEGGIIYAEDVQDNGQFDSRAMYVRHMVQGAKSSFFSSATYAKNPDSMVTYAYATNMRDAVKDISKLPEIIKRGGVPLQQVIANKLVQDGQYLRRERSYDGVSMEVMELNIDKQRADDLSGFLGAIYDFDTDMIAAKKNLKDIMKESAEAMALDNAVGEEGLTSANFTSIMHNLISQVLMATKIKAVADKAIELHKQGIKPLIALSNTNESFVTDYMAANELSEGDDVSELDFSSMLLKYLSRTREYAIKKDNGAKPERKTISDADLKQLGVYDKYKAVEKKIKDYDLSDMPISPIDYLLHRMTQAGMKAEEMTGRSIKLQYTDDNTRVLAKRTNTSKDVITGRFNSGELDAVILNKASSTGISLHASEKFKDKKQRHMMILQPDPNIDTFMQMLGRIHRTGQVTLPAFSIVSSDLPAEKRPAARLMKKMASLNANTTANKKSAISLDNVTDFMNEYGDDIVRNMLSEEPDIAKLLDPTGKAQGDKIEGLASTITGRMALLPIKEQERIYGLIEKTYNDQIAYLDAIGENVLEAKELDFQAIPLTEKSIAIGSGKNSFDEEAKVVDYSVRRLGKPYKWDVVKEKVAASLGKMTDVQHATSIFEAYKNGTSQSLKVNFYDRFMKAKQKAAQSKTEEDQKAAEAAYDAYANVQTLIENVKRFLTTFRVGSYVVIERDAGNLTGVVVDYTVDTKNLNSPLGLGNIHMRVAVADAIKEISIPLNRAVRKSEKKDPELTVRFADRMQPKEMQSRFDSGQTESRENVKIVTGNMLAGFETFKTGRIIFFTEQGGGLKEGLILPKGMKVDEILASTPTPIDFSEIEDFKNVRFKKKTNVELKTSDDVAFVTIAEDAVKLTIKSARGGKFYLNKRLREITGDFFGGQGKSDMHVTLPMDKGMRAVQHMIDVMGAKMMAVTGQTDLMALRGLGKEVKLNDVKLSKPFVEAGSQKKSDSTVKMMGNYSNPMRVVPIAPEKWTKSLRQRTKAMNIIAREAFGSDLQQVFVNEIRDESNDLVHGAFGTDTEGGVVNYFSYVSLKAADMVHVMNHEGIHYLKKRGVFSDKVWSVLTEQADIEWINKYQIRSRYPDGDQALWQEEAIAEAYADFASKHIVLPTSVIKLVFGKIQRFLKRIASSLNTMGIDESEQVFRDIASGKYNPSKLLKQDATTGILEYEPYPSQNRYSRPPADQRVDTIHVPDVTMFDVLRDANIKVLDVIRQGKTWDVVYASYLSARAMIQDQFVPFMKVQAKIEERNGYSLGEAEDVYLNEELYTGRAGARLDDLKKNYIEPIIGMVHDLDQKVRAKGLKDSSGQNYNGLQYVERYMIAKHAEERNVAIAAINPKMPDGGSGMTTEDANAFLDDVQNSSVQEEIKKIEALWREMLKNQLQARVEYGLMTQKEADIWANKYANYVPLKGYADMDAMQGRLGMGGKGYSVRGAESLRALGRSSMATDILGNSLALAEQAIIRGEQNKVGLSALNLARANPKDKNLWEVNEVITKAVLNQSTGLVEYRSMALPVGTQAADDTLFVKENGKEWRITFHDKRLAAGLKNLDVERLGFLWRTAGLYNRFLSKVNTVLNIEFVLTNAIRDVQTGLINAAAIDEKGLVKDVFKGWTSGFKGAAQGIFDIGDSESRQYYEEYRAAGGKVSFFQVDDVNGMVTRLQKELALKKNNPKAVALRTARAGLDIIYKTNDTIESALRLSVYTNLRKRGMSEAHAAQVAKNITVNFNKKGSKTNQLSAMYLFFNPTVQSLVIILKALAKSKKVRRIAMGLVVAGVLEDMLNQMFSPEDEDGRSLWDKIPQYEKESNAILMLPPKMIDALRPIFPVGVIDKVEYVKMPLFYGYRTFIEAGRNASAAGRGAITPMTAATNIVMSVVNNYLPMNLGNGWEALIPTAFKSIIDVNWTNRNFFGSPINELASQYDKTPAPDAYQYYPSASLFSQRMADSLNKATGGNDFRPGLIDVSPGSIDYMASYHMGGLGSFIKRIADGADRILNDEPMEVSQIPFVRKVVGKNNPMFETGLAYDRMKEVLYAVKEYKGFAARGDVAQTKRVMQEYGELLGLSQNVNMLQKSLRDMSKQRKIINANAQLTDKQRRDAVRANYKRQELYVNAFNRSYNRAMKLMADDNKSFLSKE
jgi:Inorganic Pyrophosphatase/Large polyvalent protein associated domain 38/C-terminal domain on Strawberry notch homologue/P-loop containing NTP hydrolase pore-1